MKYLLIVIVVVFVSRLPGSAQDNNYGVKGFNPKTFNVPDSSTVTYNGLQAGYSIESESEKSVNKKGDFSRYKIKFWVKNVSTEARIMYRNIDFNGHAGPLSNNIALFKCLNATGARLTNKAASMELQPCKIMATVEEKECGTDKVRQVSKIVDLGFWIKPGEMVSKTYPMIVPLNERPNVTITFYSEVANQTGEFITTSRAQNVSTDYVRIKNFATNDYLNNQPGRLVSTPIENGWWSADWEVIAIEGTSNFQIRNRWKGLYLSSGNEMLTEDMNNSSAMWTIQETNTANVYYIKNVSDNARLFVENGTLKVSNKFISNDNTSKWVIEK